MDPTPYSRSFISTEQVYEEGYVSNFPNLFRPESDLSKLYAWINTTPGEDSLVPNSQASEADGSGSVLATADMDKPPSEFARVLPTREGRFQVLKNVSDVQNHVQSHTAEGLRIAATHLQKMFDELMRAYRVFGRFKDVLVHLGSRHREIEVAPPRLQHNILLSDDVNRQYAGFECCYALRFVELNGRYTGLHAWSLRQFAVYNQVRTLPDTSRWIFVSLPAFAQEAVNQYHASSGSEIRGRPFEIHYLVLRKAIAQWRPYFAYMKELVDSQTLTPHIAQPDVEPDAGASSVEYCSWDERQQLKRLEDKILDVILALAATQSTLQQFLKIMKITTEQAPSHASSDASTRDIVRSGFEDLVEETEAFQQQAQSLREKLRTTSETVSTFLGLRTAAFARHQNDKMGVLTAKSAHDAAAVKVLTVITLIYLPTTVVSNFFSTSFVETRAHPGFSSRIAVLGDWWIFVAVSLPLTLLTFGIWWFFVKLEETPESPASSQTTKRTSSLFYRLRSRLKSNYSMKTLKTDEERSPGSSPTLC